MAIVTKYVEREEKRNLPSRRAFFDFFSLEYLITCVMILFAWCLFSRNDRIKQIFFAQSPAVQLYFLVILHHKRLFVIYGLCKTYIKANWIVAFCVAQAGNDVLITPIEDKALQVFFCYFNGKRKNYRLLFDLHI